MRAAQTALRRPMLPRPRLTPAERTRREPVAGVPHCSLWFGAAFLAGYLPGIWLGRSGSSALGQQLAAYYAKGPESTLAAAFGTQFAVGFLQLFAVFLCGFCVWGVGLLAVLFAVRGVFLGFCAASVAAVSGASGLIQYRADTLIFDIATLFLCLWLAGWAAKLAAELFRAVCGRAVRETPGTLRRLVVRFGAAVVLSGLCSAVGAFLVLVVARLRG